jgi:hypothetical protein
MPITGLQGFQGAFREIPAVCAFRRTSFSQAGRAWTLLHAQPPPPGGSAADRGVDWIADRYRARLKQMRRVELIRGSPWSARIATTSVSSLMEQISLHTDPKGSSGRRCLRSKLAEAHFIRAHTGEMPVLLLDDVLSELDETRRTNLLGEIIGSTQVLVTSVEPGCRDLMPDGASGFHYRSRGGDAR